MPEVSVRAEFWGGPLDGAVQEILSLTQVYLVPFTITLLKAGTIEEVALPEPVIRYHRYELQTRGVAVPKKHPWYRYVGEVATA